MTSVAIFPTRSLGFSVLWIWLACTTASLFGCQPVPECLLPVPLKTVEILSTGCVNDTIQVRRGTVRFQAHFVLHEDSRDSITVHAVVENSGESPVSLSLGSVELESWVPSDKAIEAPALTSFDLLEFKGEVVLGRNSDVILQAESYEDYRRSFDLFLDPGEESPLEVVFRRIGRPILAKLKLSFQRTSQSIDIELPFTGFVEGRPL